MLGETAGFDDFELFVRSLCHSRSGLTAICAIVRPLSADLSSRVLEAWGFFAFAFIKYHFGLSPFPPDRVNTHSPISFFPKR